MLMSQRLAHVAVLVRDYDEVIAFYTKILGFFLASDQSLGGSKRWMVVNPLGPAGCLLLARANTNGFWRDYAELQARGLRFQEAPRTWPYGHVAVFEDLYGNRWDLLEPLGS